MRLSVRDLMLIPMFSALTAIGAFIRIPIPYIPITMQPFFVILAGIILGSKKGAISQLVYVLVGLAGFPVFASGGGLNYVFKTSFGYLIGYIFAAYVVGKVYERFETANFVKTYLAVLSGTFVIYLIGVPYLYMILNVYMNKPTTVAYAVQIGLIATLPKDLLVGLAIAAVANAIVPRLKKAQLLG